MSHSVVVLPSYLDVSWCILFLIEMKFGYLTFLDVIRGLLAFLFIIESLVHVNMAENSPLG